jgi:hypothetical protein
VEIDVLEEEAKNKPPMARHPNAQSHMKMKKKKKKQKKEKKMDCV